MRRLPSSLRRAVAPLSAAGSLLIATGCADAGDSAGADGPESPMTPTELAVPAVEGSGEPFLSSDGDRLWLSWLEPAGEEWALRLAAIDADVGEPTTIVQRDDFFVNWADFPSVTALDDGRLAAHWLQRGGSGTYDYGVRVAWSDDGVEWSEPWTPHEDGTPTEHGFVSTLPQGSDLGLLWLDGRRYVDGPEGEATGEMTLRYRSAAGPTSAGPETVVDGRICDCCQTGSARTTDGWVVVYRDRSEDEIRDIYAARLVDGEWTEGRPVHRDGWHIEGCPVNGPAVAAEGDRVAVGWFTGAADQPRVHLAFSEDQGITFGEPVRIDGGDPVGRVDVVMDGDGARISWIETVGASAELRMRRVTAAGVAEPPVVVSTVSGARAAGFPQMVRHRGDLVFAWTDAVGDDTRVRAARWSRAGDDR